jgi:hypothetical protein
MLVISGNHEVRFDTDELTSGVYLYKFQSGRFFEIKKLVLMKSCRLLGFFILEWYQFNKNERTLHSF